MAANTVEKRLQELENTLQSERNTNEKLVEDYNDAISSMAQLQNVGWDLIGTAGQQEFSLTQIREVSKSLREWTDTNPLLKRGLEIRASYLYSDQYEISTTDNGGEISGRVQTIIDDLDNQGAVFSIEALYTAEKDRYTNGSHFVKYDGARKKFTVVPLSEISDFVFDPDDVTRVWFYLQNYTQNKLNSDGTVTPAIVQQWIPTDSYTGSYISTIKGFSVLKNVVLIDHRVNRSSGNAFGMADCFAASPWAIAYSAYLRDGTKLLSALAEWAWKISPKTKTGGQNLGASLKQQSGAAGRTAVTDMEMTALPKAGSVDLTDGRAIAAQVASDLGISVDLLLGDESATAYTASDPVLQSMRFRQQSVAAFLTRCLKAIGMKNVTIDMGDMAKDAGYRQGQTLAGAWGTGLYWPDEIREPLADAANIQLNHPKAPKGVQIPNNENDIVGEKAAELAAAKAGIAAGQVVAPTTGASTQNADGSNSQANGQGNDATGVGKVSSGDNAVRDSANKTSIANSKPSSGK